MKTMSEIIINNVSDVIIIINELIENYKSNYDTAKKRGNPSNADSYKGSIIGLVALYCRITDEHAENMFKILFPEE